ncbi:MAG: hypothetical protein IT363_15170 [Methanoregulaceae archaeon]|nr:hypothetical protein [Methanoregulaceae archaeon]
MNRFGLLTFASALTVAASFPWIAEGPPPLIDPPINLQALTPGTAQLGNGNITGRFLAGGLSAVSSSVSGQAVYGYASAATGTTYGGFFLNRSVSGRAVYGYATAFTGPNYGGFFSSNSTTGRGVFGISGAATGTGVGVYGKSVSPNGFGGYFEGNVHSTGVFSGSGSGLTSLNAGNLTSGTLSDERLSSDIPRRSTPNSFFDTNRFSLLETTSGLSFIDDVERAKFSIASQLPYSDLLLSVGGSRFVFTEDGGLGIGLTSGRPGTRLFVQEPQGSSRSAVIVYNGDAAGFSPVKRGIQSEASGLGPAVGVLSVANNTTGAGFGVEAYAIGTTPLTNYALYTLASGGGANYAGWFNGTIYAQTATAGIKSFVIDHPLDPENKVLEHSSVESDERMNIYRGVVKTDARGYATLSVPQWFSALNTDIQYQLTVIDTSDSADFVAAKVVQKLASGSFRIRTSAGGVEVNWQVTGRRHDPTSLRSPMRIERDKLPHERGKYLVPQAYGYGDERAMAQGTRRQASPETPN